MCCRQPQTVLQKWLFRHTNLDTSGLSIIWACIYSIGTSRKFLIIKANTNMKILCDSGIVRARKEGNWMYYSIDPEGCARAHRLLYEMTDSGDSDDSNNRCGCSKAV